MLCTGECNQKTHIVHKPVEEDRHRISKHGDVKNDTNYHGKEGMG